MKTFEELGVSAEIRQAIEEMGYENPMPVQEEVIPYLLGEGNDVVALAQTGTGKTAAFGLPLIQKTDVKQRVPQALILCPTRELCLQIAGDLNDYSKYIDGLKVLPVYGGSSIESQIRMLKTGVHIIVATPGRLIDLMERGVAKLDNIINVVMDEADEMLNMGFYKDVRHIIDLMKNRKSLSMFSATISREVMDIGWLYQHDAAEVTVQPKLESMPKIAQYKLLTTNRDKLGDLAQLVIGEGYKRVMVFCNTKFTTATLCNQLARLNFSVDCLHGDLSQAERNRIMTRFREGQIAMLVATDVAARGIDVSDVDAVVNYDVPSENEHYTHRIGRTGRAKREGSSYLFYTKEEQRRVEDLLRLTGNTEDCLDVKFDFNHEHIVVQEKKTEDKFQIKMYF